MLSPSKLDLCEEKSEKQHCNKPCNNESDKSQSLSVTSSINNHKRNRQSYSEKNQAQLTSNSAQATEKCNLISEIGSHIQNRCNEEATIETKFNSVNNRIDTQIDRCSVAKKPRDDISEMGDTGEITSKVQPWSKVPSNQKSENYQISSTEKSVLCDESSPSRLIQEDYRFVFNTTSEFWSVLISKVVPFILPKNSVSSYKTKYICHLTKLLF